MKHTYAFPKGFEWGCATASYQVEGAAWTGGRKASVWDTFCRQPGRVALDQSGDVGCNQYRHYRADAKLMKGLGLKCYRFSVAWPRVFPDGFGKRNAKGLAYYDRLVDALLANGIEPWVTLFHWDLPQALQDRYGGWESREVAPHFADYAAAVTRCLSDRVINFFTINEFVCFTDAGYSQGGFPPGKMLPNKARNQVRHNAVLAHGMAVQALRAHAKRNVRVGLAENAAICTPVIETAEHIAAARKAMRVKNAPFLTAVMEGRYHPDYLKAEGADAPAVQPGDMAIIGSPLDFVGLNIYTPVYVRADDSPAGFAEVPHPESSPRMHMPWLHFGPQAIYWGVRHASEIWNVRDVRITENGCASEDKPTPDGEIYDTDRTMYLRNHFIAAQRAVSEGYPLKGYFVWSLMDNFEWCYGYTKRFGIVYVNFTTQQRTLKLSAKFYREVIRRNAVV
jgi:beta-glucosidase